MANSATASGNKQAPNAGPLKCGDVGTYSEMTKRKTNRQERDHVPATSSMIRAAENKPWYKKLDGDQENCVKAGIRNQALVIAIPKGVHVKHSRTCKGRGGQARINADAADLDAAAEKDIAALEKKVPPGCRDAYKEAAEKVKAQDQEGLIEKVRKECTAS